MPNRRNLLKGGGAAVAAAVGVGAAAKANATESLEINRQRRHTVRNRAMILLDRSGSMASAQAATIAGINDFLDQQRDKPDLFLSLLQFDTAGSTGLNITETFVDVSAPDAPKLTTKDFQPRGGTPLLAAVSHAIATLERDATPNDKLLLVVQTDGAENTSPPEITKEIIASLIAAKTAEGNWTFAFMGADIDAWGTSSLLNVSQANTLAYAGVQSRSAWNTTSGSTNSWYLSGATNTADTFYIDTDQTSTPKP